VRLLLALAVTAMLAPAAHAEPPTDRPLTGTRYTASLAAAVEFWHAAPPCQVRFYAATDAELKEFTGVDAQAATYSGVQGADCPIWISDTLAAPTIENRLRTGLDITHEVGHRLDYPHDDTPWSMMNPTQAGMPWPVFKRFAPPGYLRTWRDLHPGEPWATRPS